MSDAPAAAPLLEVRDLRTYFFLDEGTVKAVDGVDLKIGANATVGVVGESGCGKSVTARSILRIVDEPGRIVEGSILLEHKGASVDLAALDNTGPELRRIRGKEISMIFQEPMTSFSPLYTIGNQIMEAILLHQDVDKNGARTHAIEMLDRVGIPKPADRIDSYPHEMSGGMRQRAMIAMALSCNPRLLIADEPTTAVDVTIQAQILDLLQRLQDDFQMSVMVITHNLGVVAELAQEVLVMYLGRVVERAPVDVIFNDPKHPYTRALQRSIPHGGTRGQRLESIKGVVPHPFSAPQGCPFANRCPEAIKGTCDAGTPPALREVSAGHDVACFLYHEERVTK